jgi:hypothetical protein
MRGQGTEVEMKAEEERQRTEMSGEDVESFNDSSDAFDGRGKMGEMGSWTRSAWLSVRTETGRRGFWNSDKKLVLGK